MKISLVKQSDTLMAYDDDAYKFLSKKKENEVFVIDIKSSQNPLYHRRAFKMLRIMFDMIDSDLDFEPWRVMLTILAGYSNTVAEVTKDGTTKVYVYPQSLSYENMDDEQFRKWFQSAHRAFCHKFGDLLTLEQLQEWAEM